MTQTWKYLNLGYLSMSDEYLRNENGFLQMRYARGIAFRIKDMCNSSLPSLIGWFVSYLESTN
jgi:hypothetical protein